KAIQQLDQVIQQNASATEQIASTAEELSSQAVQLIDTIGYFKVDNKDRAAKGPKAEARKVIAAGAQGSHNGNGNGKARAGDAAKGAGVVLDLGESRDGLDSEFERF
ncbi:MAG TPA: hypothetical protein PLR60_16820, partial [Syntrophorhabdaceae bacterium]|nr:hypothetical protein [Syntrophorhabdaceae bacterium]